MVKEKLIHDYARVGEITACKEKMFLLHEYMNPMNYKYFSLSWDPPQELAMLKHCYHHDNDARSYLVFVTYVAFLVFGI